MSGGAFEVAKQLEGELTGGVDTAAFRADAEAFGSALVEVGSIPPKAVCWNITTSIRRDAVVPTRLFH